MEEPWLDIVLPCLDEAGALPWVLARMPSGTRALVVDNGSTDGSPEVARRLGATVLQVPQRGYGAACDAGLRAARADLVAFCDCDASLDPTDAARLAELVRQDRADLVIGRRRPLTRRAWPVTARLANAELARRIRRRTGLRLADLGPLRVARRDRLLDVARDPRVGRSKVTGTPLGAWRAVRDMSAVLAR